MIDRMARTFYGQFEPPLDQIIFERFFFDEPQGLVLIECGAADGMSGSSGLFFEQTLNWQCYNIEADPEHFKKLQHNRQRAINVQAALSNQTGIRTFYRSVHATDQNIRHGSLSHAVDHAWELQQQGVTLEQAEVTTLSIDDFIKNHAITQIDVLVLDIEGQELEVVRRLHECEVIPEIICIDHSLVGLDALAEVLTVHGYYIHSTHESHAFFVLEQSARNQLLQATDLRPRVAVCCVLSPSTAYYQALFCYLLASTQTRCKLSSVNLIVDVDPEPSLYADILMRRGVQINIEKRTADQTSAYADTLKTAQNHLNQCIDMALQRDSGAAHIALITEGVCFPYDMLETLTGADQDIVAPAVFLGSDPHNGSGYTNTDGSAFDHKKRVELMASSATRDLIELGSISTFAVVKRELFDRGLHRSDQITDNQIKALCERAVKAGFKIYLKGDMSTVYASSFWEQRVWTITRVHLTTNGTLTDTAPCNWVVPSDRPDFLRSLVANGVISFAGELERIEVENKNTHDRVFNLRIHSQQR